MQSIFEGLWIPIVTPFREDRVDHPALERLAQHLAGQGIAGFVAGATTGEGVLLRAGEQEAVFASLRRAAPALPIVLGVTAFSTDAATAQARALAALRPEGLLVTPPAYVLPAQAGIRRHFEVVAEAADLPLLVYNIPYRTGVTVELETLQALATDPRIAGIKECGGSPERLMRLVHETPLRVLSGDDSQNFVALCLGAHGSIAASAHIRPDLHVRMHALLRAGQVDAARQIAVSLQAMIAALFAEPNPAPLKAWLEGEGWCAADLRLPFTAATAPLRETLARHGRVLQALA
ncbi:4-hydroxy-tetrahydrodipicolinate synthase [Niveibacterium sp. 24ML]|uniref:4-hydroxy-tetrahydrodipicolinate synthase n=1 Tax=Niveibacterium sp. 24ML TaxID=2985512 RepID=UPI00226FE09D|nr:4-hydroxy-tetrahydrodipicolinate synthase [Niveibacterium sp. 24ML]MCX9156303.1 4-hydroxy-tetrahydrodipicolinate synthase [Niveibacterium sp. 24ML]